MKQLTVSVCSRLWSQPWGYAKTTNRIVSSETKENAFQGSCFEQDPFIFPVEKEGIPINTPDNILYKAASVWKQLTEYRYVLTYGYKQKLYTINLTFSLGDFHHLAGFQYLKDITLPKAYYKKTVELILNQKIKYEQVIKGMYYEEKVKPRLEALVRFEDILNNEFLLFTYRADMYPFPTTIKADYLISSHVGDVTYVFIIKDSASAEIKCDYLCCSTFTKDKRDYEINQQKRALLKKERVHIPTKTSTILFDRLGSA